MKKTIYLILLMILIAVRGISQGKQEPINFGKWYLPHELYDHDYNYYQYYAIKAVQGSIIEEYHRGWYYYFKATQSPITLPRVWKYNGWWFGIYYQNGAYVGFYCQNPETMESNHAAYDVIISRSWWPLNVKQPIYMIFHKDLAPIMAAFASKFPYREK